MYECWCPNQYTLTQGGKTHRLQFKLTKAQQSITTSDYAIPDLQGPMIFYSFADPLLSSVRPPCNPAYLPTLRLALVDQWHSVRLGF